MAKRKRSSKFPDLTGPEGKRDGKVTKADILAGRGIIPKDREDSSHDLFIDEVMNRVEESQLLVEQEVNNLCEGVDETYNIFGVNFNSMNERTDNVILSLLEDYDNLDDGEILGSICEALNLDPYDLSDDQLNEFFGMFKNKAKARRGALVNRMTKNLGGKENAMDRAKRRLQGHRIANENPEGTMAGRRASRNPKGGKIVTKQIGNTTARRNTASVFNAKSGKNNPDRLAKAKATKDNPLDSEGRQKDIYAAVRQKAQAARRRGLGRSGAAKKADTTPEPVRGSGMRGTRKATADSTDIVRGARLALAERVLNAMSETVGPLPKPPETAEEWAKLNRQEKRRTTLKNAKAAGVNPTLLKQRTDPVKDKARTNAILDTGLNYKSRK